MRKPKEPQNPYDEELLQSIIESFARFLAPETREFSSGEEGQQTFRMWEKEHNNGR